MSIARSIITAFDRAAPDYDAASALQREVAQHLVQKARGENPRHILDIGCGTGHVTALAAQKWPMAALTALDAAPAMLREAQKKVPRLRMIESDAAHINMDEKYDLIFSSMLLHWLPDPHLVLRRWQKHLTRQGKLYVALPVEGSLSEWRDLCRAHHIADGIWHFPRRDFAQGIAVTAETAPHKRDYADLHAFLRSLKQTGANRPQPGHKPASLRRLLRETTGAFAATYEILYLECGAGY